MLSPFFYNFQLIGWQEVSRPNSRNEIVQAMRRIRVSIAIDDYFVLRHNCQDLETITCWIRTLLESLLQNV